MTTLPNVLLPKDVEHALHCIMSMHQDRTRQLQALEYKLSKYYQHEPKCRSTARYIMRKIWYLNATIKEAVSNTCNEYQTIYKHLIDKLSQIYTKNGAIDLAVQEMKDICIIENQSETDVIIDSIIKNAFDTNKYQRSIHKLRSFEAELNIAYDETDSNINNIRSNATQKFIEMENRYYIYIFLDGFIRSMLSNCIHLVSIDIIDLIIRYYESAKYVVLINNNNSEIIPIYNNINGGNKQFETNWTYSSPKTFFQSQSPCIVQGSSLPYHIKKQLLQKNNNYDEYIDPMYLESTDWNLVLGFIKTNINVTAFHSSNRDYGYKCDILPRVIPETYYFRYKSMIYSKAETKLYLFGVNLLFSLDFCPNESINVWRWKCEQKLDFIDYFDKPSVCMVDNDRFIACMNAKNGIQSYLLLNDNNYTMSIRLNDSCKRRHGAVSMYHNVYHKIITIDGMDAEWYDINKDKSMILCNNIGAFHISNVCYSRFNPNIVHCGAQYRNEFGYQIALLALDLRNGQSYPIISSYSSKFSMFDCVYLPSLF